MKQVEDLESGVYCNVNGHFKGEPNAKRALLGNYLLDDFIKRIHRTTNLRLGQLMVNKIICKILLISIEVNHAMT